MTLNLSRFTWLWMGSIFLAVVFWSAVLAQSSSEDSPRTRLSAAAAGVPEYCITPHNIGKLYVGITNFGRLSYGNETFFFDCFTGKKIPDVQYPKGTNTVYLFKGGLWVGGVVGNDTLVSTAEEHDVWSREFHPEVSPFGTFVRRSTLGPTDEMARNARSEQDLIATYTDTLTFGNSYPSFDEIENRGHEPLGIEVRQESYAWSYAYADDFILLNYHITNISEHPISNMYVGLHMDPDVSRFSVDPNASQPGTAKTSTGGRDDIAGFLYSYPARYYDMCDYEDTLWLAWVADVDGDVSLANGIFQVPHVTGVRLLRPPQEDERFAFNWWVPNYNSVYDFGPQLRKNYRLLGGGVGTPVGDRNKYFLLGNGEIDYSQPLTGRVSVADPDWATPNQDIAVQLSKGGDVQYLMSIGPYQLDPGEEVEVPFAYVAGESLHVSMYNGYHHLRFGYRPERYLEGLKFRNLATNAVWAARIYDNPGTDSDEDGYAGKMRLCLIDSALVAGEWVYVVDTTYYEGDGMPDWRAATPPPAPKVWLAPTMNGINVRFNGYASETTRDFLSGLVDFEGYHVYVGRDDREASLSVAASYDNQNYDVYVYNPAKKPLPGYDLSGTPATLEQLRCRFSGAADPCSDTFFHPLNFGLTNPYRSPIYLDTIVYFTPHADNTFRFGTDTPIRKRYPDEPQPTPGQPIPPTAYTEDGYLKYYDYECEIPGLLPTVPYYVNVTAFDFGSPEAGLAPLESARLLRLQSAYAYSAPEQLSDTLPPVYVYPNPYRVDDHYRGGGWEGRAREDAINDRVRAIHFVNVPPTCTIRIHTLDGDLVREIQHDTDPSDPKANHATWDMISRNVQMIVSGVYYWSVEDTQGRVQIGTFVVVM